MILRRLLDTGRAYREFGFKARVNLEEGLKMTIGWYLSTKESKQPR
jgi:GDP-L-fucose synthase